MVIEWLKFTVSPEVREKFIKKDEAIWTAALATYPGFLGKEIWLEPTRADNIIFIIRWQSRQQWKSIPVEDLTMIEQRFAAAMGKDNYEMIESKEFQVRKFPEAPK